MDITQGLVIALQAWGGIGAITAAVFLTIGIDRIDEDARGAYVFRPLLIPGVMLIWPLVLWRWWQIETEASGWAARYRPVRKAHGIAAVLLSFGIVAIVILGLSARQDWPADTAPVQLSQGINQ